MSRASSVVSGSFAESVQEKTKGFVDNHCWAYLDNVLQPQVCHVVAKEDPLVRYSNHLYDSKIQ